MIGTQTRVYASCQHAPLAANLLQDGYFPSAPRRPAYAFCIEFLRFVAQLSVRSTAATHSVVGALSSFHEERGQYKYNKQVGTLPA